MAYSKKRTALERKLEELKAQRERSSEEVLAAENASQEDKRREQEISVAAVAQGEAAAVSEAEELHSQLIRHERRAAMAKVAVQKFNTAIARTEEEIAEEHRQEHLRRFEKLARERAALEDELEGELGAPLGGLAALRELDQKQRLEAYEAGQGDVFATHTLDSVLAAWLSARLGGYQGYLPSLTRSDWHQQHTLAEVDPLASKVGESVA